MNFHSVMDSPDRVNRVTPPRITRLNTHPELIVSHTHSWLRCDSVSPSAMLNDGPCTSEAVSQMSVGPARRILCVCLIHTFVRYDISRIYGPPAQIRIWHSPLDISDIIECTGGS